MPYSRIRKYITRGTVESVRHASPQSLQPPHTGYCLSTTFFFKHGCR